MLLMITTARLVLACVFLASAVGKIRDRAGSRSAIEAFGFPKVLVGTAAAGLPAVELACAALLLSPDPAATVGALGSALLLAAFTVAIVANLARGRRPSCHCFGASDANHPISARTVARNLGLLALAALALADAGNLAAVTTVLRDSSALGTLVAVSAITGVGTMSVAAIRRSRARLPRSARPHGGGGDLDLRKVAGSPVLLSGLPRHGRPTFVVFISPTCGRCSDLLPDLSAWQAEGGQSFPVVVSDGSWEDVQRKLRSAGPIEVVLRDAATSLADLGIAGVPAAVLLDGEGRPVGSPSYGVDGVRELRAATLETATLERAACEAPPPRITTSAWDAPVVATTGRYSQAGSDTTICSDGAGCADD